MLRTNAFTLTTTDTITRTAASAYQSVVEKMRTIVILRISALRIQCTEHIRNQNTGRTAVHAITTGGTRNKRHTMHLLHYRCNHRLFLLRKRLEIRKGINIILHLLLGRHTT